MMKKHKQKIIRSNVLSMIYKILYKRRTIKFWRNRKKDKNKNHSLKVATYF